MHLRSACWNQCHNFSPFISLFILSNDYTLLINDGALELPAGAGAIHRECPYL